MFVLIKDVVLVVVSLITGALVSLGLLPAPAVAPDVTPPTPVVETVATTTSGAPESVEAGDVSGAGSTGTEPSGNAPLVDDFQKSLQDALNALAALEAEKNAQDIGNAALNDVTREAVVNVLCTTAGAGPFNPISGSGVVVHPSGVVVTNAHVAQYFLLKDYPRKDFVDCIVRTGSPAKPAYKADLLFLPPTWIAENAQKIDDERPTGNGEHDYALLLLTGLIAAPDVSAPAQFPYLPIVSGEPTKGARVLLAGYPAGFLGGVTIQTNLYKTSAEATVGGVYTYGGSTVDLFSIGGTVVAQSGSSGGAVAVANKESQSGAALLGVIVTSSDAPDTASRDLRAISTNYIIRDFEKEAGVALQDFLNGNLPAELVSFHALVFPTLSQALINVLKQ